MDAALFARSRTPAHTVADVRTALLEGRRVLAIAKDMDGAWRMSQQLCRFSPELTVEQRRRYYPGPISVAGGGTCSFHTEQVTDWLAATRDSIIWVDGA